MTNKTVQVYRCTQCCEGREPCTVTGVSIDGGFRGPKCCPYFEGTSDVKWEKVVEYTFEQEDD